MPASPTGRPATPASGTPASGTPASGTAAKAPAGSNGGSVAGRGSAGSPRHQLPPELAMEPVRWWHLARLAELEVELFGPDAWSHETWWGELARPDRHYLVLAPDPSDRCPSGQVDGGQVDGGQVDGGQVDGGQVDGGQVDGGQVDGGQVASSGRDQPRDRVVAGYGGIAVQGGEADLMTLAVVPEHRGTGLGRTLLDALLHAAHERGARRMTLEVRADNASARRLYERAGFERLGIRRGYYRGQDGSPVDALMLRRALP
ncbi:MAG: ribosomal protein S18-alanine N-acetyltransferase [Angustibacter sp.]